MQQFQLRRINAFQGLMIDAAVWRDAHEYHRDQMRLHQLALHGWGIVHGLDVTVERSDKTLLIAPGIAVDPAGNFIVVSQPQVFRVESRTAGTVYLVMQFREVLTGPTQSGLNGVGPPIHVVEAYQVQERDQPPGELHLELARIQLDPAAGPVAAATNPEQPGTNELDLRFRVRVGTSSAPAAPVPTPIAGPVRVEDTPRAAASAPSSLFSATGTGGGVPGVLEIGVGAHGGPGWDRHREGLRLLAREVEATINAPVRVVEPLELGQADRVDVLYLTGETRLGIGDAEKSALSRFLERGGLLVGEGCANGSRGEAGAREFALSFVEVADGLGRRLAEVERGHPMLLTRHVFAQPPTGGGDRARVVVAGGLLYSDADYGCAWRGGASDRPLSRGAIRDAIEFGVNLVLYRPKAQ